MRIKDYNFHNKYVDFNNESINFDKYGVYLVKGENGTGKTTMLKDIIFDREDIIFEDEQQEKCFKTRRGKVFSYVPQRFIQPSVSIREYLNIYRFDREKFDKMMSILELDHLKLSANIKKLSKGEFLKLCILKNILKDTPYLFLDEPTNNLDNNSVRNLMEILDEYGKNHTVIMITHDPRVEDIKGKMITIKEGTITQGDNEGIINKKEPNKRITKKNGKLFKKVITSPYFLLSIIITIVMLIFLAKMNYDILKGRKTIKDSSEYAFKYSMPSFVALLVCICYFVFRSLLKDAGIIEDYKNYHIIKRSLSREYTAYRMGIKLIIYALITICTYILSGKYGYNAFTMLNYCLLLFITETVATVIIFEIIYRKYNVIKKE